MCFQEIDIKDMKEDDTYVGICPYCGEEEPHQPGLEQALLDLQQYEKTPQFFVKQAELSNNIPNEKWYEVNGKKYPFIANLQYFYEAYTPSHYVITTCWNEIHCCPKCKKEYYTRHKH